MKVALNCPPGTKRMAIARGVKFDIETKTVYASNPPVLQRCLEWAPPGTAVPTHREWKEYSYEQKKEARADGMRWDAMYRCWYQPVLNTCQIVM